MASRNSRAPARSNNIGPRGEQMIGCLPLRNQHMVQLASLSFREYDIAHERLATQFDSGWSGAKPQRAIVAVSTIETD
jgi:hypothetical protein